jgi:tetratricopeptide (TPR) repeat protein
MLSSKIINLSDALYNKGLMKARISDISGAIDCLEKSVALNKNNIDARNLLGLAQCEIGHIGEAMRQWKLSAKISGDNNQANEYIAQMQKNARQFEKYNDSILMFNQAFDYIRQKSDDMAIIQLKKATEINPKFIDALNLLSLCYLMQNEKEKALSTIEKALQVDANNNIALYYHSLIFPARTRPELAKPSKKASVSAPSPQLPSSGLSRLSASEPKNISSSFPIVGILGFIIGGICAFAILYILIMPARIAEKDSVIASLENDIFKNRENYESLLEEAKIENEALTSSNESLESRNSELEGQVLIMDKLRKVTDAQLRLNENLYVEALDIVANIDPANLPQEAIEQIQTIRSTAYPALVEENYRAAMIHYNARRYTQAQELFEAALKYLMPEDLNADDVLYYLARTVQILYDDNDTAKLYYQRIIDDYPDSNQAANAIYRIGLIR